MSTTVLGSLYCVGTFLGLSLLVVSVWFVGRAPWRAEFTDVQVLEGECVRIITVIGALYGYMSVVAPHAVCVDNEPVPDQVPQGQPNQQDITKLRAFLTQVMTQKGRLTTVQAGQVFQQHVTNPAFIRLLSSDPQFSQSYLTFLKTHQVNYSAFAHLFHTSLHTSGSEAPHFALAMESYGKVFVKAPVEDARSVDLMSTDGQDRLHAKTLINGNYSEQALINRMKAPQNPSVNGMSLLVDDAIQAKLLERAPNECSPQFEGRMKVYALKTLTPTLVQNCFDRTCSELPLSRYTKVQAEMAHHVAKLAGLSKTPSKTTDGHITDLLKDEEVTKSLLNAK